MKEMLNLKNITIGLGAILVLGILGVSGYFIYQARVSKVDVGCDIPASFQEPMILRDPAKAQEGVPFIYLKEGASPSTGKKGLIVTMDRLESEEGKPYPILLYIDPKVLEIPFLITEETTIGSNVITENPGKVDPYTFKEGEKLAINYEISECKLFAIDVVGGISPPEPTTSEK